MSREAEMAIVMRGAPVAAQIMERLRLDSERLRREAGIAPGLAVVLAGGDPPSRLYVQKKAQQAETVGVRVFDHALPADCSQGALLALLERLNRDDRVHGIFLQVPLPAGVDTVAVAAAVDPAKDVEGFHPLNRGLLATGETRNTLLPCAPLAGLILLRRTLGSLAGLEAVVLGRSAIIGKPMAQLLLHANCTVTTAHSHTRNLPDVCRRADILATALGKPRFIRGDWLKPGSSVVDLAINLEYRPDGSFRVVGDVMFDEAAAVVKAITPVPGGIGPLTVACLLANTVTAACRVAGVETYDWLSVGLPET